MKKLDKRKTIIFSVVLLLILAIIISIVLISKKPKRIVSNDELELFDTNLAPHVKQTKSGIKVNVSPEINQDKKLDGLSITEIQLTSKNGIATLLGNVTNNTSARTSLKNFEVIFIDTDGNEITRAKGVIRDLNPGESTKINVSMSSNCITAFYINFE